MHVLIQEFTGLKCETLTPAVSFSGNAAEIYLGTDSGSFSGTGSGTVDINTGQSQGM